MAYLLVLGELLVLGAAGAGLSGLSLLHPGHEEVLVAVKLAIDIVDNAILVGGPHCTLEGIGLLEHREDAGGAVPCLAAVVLDAAFTVLVRLLVAAAGHEGRKAARRNLCQEHLLALLAPLHLVGARSGDLLHLRSRCSLSTRNSGRPLGWHSSSISRRLWHWLAPFL